MIDHILIAGRILLEVDGPEGKMLTWAMGDGTLYIAAPIASVHLSEDMHKAMKEAIENKITNKLK